VSFSSRAPMGDMADDRLPALFHCDISTSGPLKVPTSPIRAGKPFWVAARQNSAIPWPTRHNCNEMAIRLTSEGDYRFTDELSASRFYRGARYGTFGGGTSETLTGPGRQEAHERLRRSGWIPYDGNVLMRTMPRQPATDSTIPRLAVSSCWSRAGGWLRRRRDRPSLRRNHQAVSMIWYTLKVK
jgi:hypothetical protein